MIKILHVNYSDSKGGAAIGVNRLHNALKSQGIDSLMLVAEKNIADNSIISPEKSYEILFNKFKIIISRFLRRKIIKTENKGTFSFNYFDTNMLKKINDIDADLVNLHWIGNEFLSISQIQKINKPIVWTFWDMWPLCGAEHHPIDKRYIEGYTKNNCPQKEKKLDINRYIWEQKKKKLNFKFHIIALSNWMHKRIKESKLYSKNEISYLPLHINTKNWKKRDKKYSREVLGLDKNKKILLFGSATSVNDRKGFDFLIDLFNKNKFENCILVIFGLKPKNLSKLNIEYIYLGEYKDVSSLNLLYSAADLLLMPSKIEVFGLIGLESQACGTPVISFKDTGPEDYILNNVTGYLADFLDLEDFTNGINLILDNEERYSQMSNNCLKKIKEEFDDQIIVKKYIQLYKKIIKID